MTLAGTRPPTLDEWEKYELHHRARLESTDNIDNTDNADGSSAPTPELKTPRTKKELEDALGTVNESGKWTPPAGSHIDPKTGNILNKDGVVVGTTQEPYSKARPGSQG